jgi:hypothetical protein
MTHRLHHLRAQARLAWHVFRGRPLAYRVGVEGGLVIGPRTWVHDCDIRLGGQATAAIDMLPGATDCLIADNVGSAVTSFRPPTVGVNSWIRLAPGYDPEAFARAWRDASRKGRL